MDNVPIADPSNGFLPAQMFKPRLDRIASDLRCHPWSLTKKVFPERFPVIALSTRSPMHRLRFRLKEGHN